MLEGEGEGERGDGLLSCFLCGCSSSCGLDFSFFFKNPMDFMFFFFFFSFRPLVWPFLFFSLFSFPLFLSLLFFLFPQPRKIQFLPTSCWLNFSAPIFFVWLLHIFARTQTKETPSDLCTFDLAIGLFVFLGYFFFLFLLISPHCGYFFLLLSLGSWVFMVNFPSKWMLFCLHSNS